jgi:hypothetical protein
MPSLPHHENERQCGVNDFWSCVLWNLTSDRVYSVIKEFLAAFICKTHANTLHAPSRKWASTECQRFLVMGPVKPHLRQGVFSHNGIFACLYRPNTLQYPPCQIMKMSVHGASTIVCHVSWVICGATDCTLLYTDYWLPL